MEPDGETQKTSIYTVSVYNGGRWVGGTKEGETSSVLNVLISEYLYSLKI
jgi:hypothetical protein